jgi:two-component system, NtrC family, sensor histidine kinase PilS
VNTSAQIPSRDDVAGASGADAAHAWPNGSGAPPPNLNASSRQRALPAQFAGRVEAVPDAFWKSLGLFNLSRMVLAGVLLAAILIYRDGRVFGASNPQLFYQTVIVYFCLTLAFWWAFRKLRTVFVAHLTVQAVTDIVVVALLLHASGGIRSGLGILLLMPLAAAASVSRGRMSLFFAALATFALFVENTYWVLQHETGLADYLPVGFMAAACFAVALVTNRLAKRLVTNEELVRVRSADLRNQLEINRLVIRDMPSGVLAIDAEGQVRLANPEAERLLEQTALTGQSLAKLAPGLHRIEQRWRTASGSARPQISLGGRDVQVRLLETTGGEQGELLIFLEDSSKLKEQAQQLKLAALGRLTANIAHEIRNPLSAISHAAELLREEAAPEAARLTRIISENSARLDRIVQEVLQLNRRDRAATEEIGLAGWLRSFVEQIASSEKIPVTAFRLHLPAETTVSVDRQHLHQIMWNLVTNSWRHSLQRDASVQIGATILPAGKTEVHVIDDGAGVDEESAGQLFEPFFTTESRGTGLGLYIARELADANRASLDFVPPAERRAEIRVWAGDAGADFRLILEGVFFVDSTSERAKSERTGRT